MAAGRFVAALLERGHTVQLVRPRQESDPPTTPPGLELMLVGGIEVPFHRGLQLGLPAGRRLLCAWSHQAPDLVHILSEGPLGRSALRAARRLGLPVTTSFHTNFHRYARDYGLGWLQPLVTGYLRRFHSAAARTLVPTRQVLQELTGHGFSRLAVVGRGVDCRLFSPEKRSPQLRRGWAADPDSPVVLMVGRLAPEKNLDLGIETFLAMRRARADARLVLVGDGPERRRLQAAHPSFVFTGMLRGEDLAAHYASADVFLFPSLTETFGNVCLEAMASGLAVCAFADAAALEHIRHGGNGLLADARRPQEFVANAVRLVREPAVAWELARRARDTALELGWDTIGDRLEWLLRSAVREDYEGTRRVAINAMKSPNR